MSEWLKEHAWKTIPATLTEPHRRTSTPNQINGLPLPDASRCDAVFARIYREFRARLTQFLHSSRFDLFAYAVVSLGVRQYALSCRLADPRSAAVQ
jgi:hypothetical protein